MPLVRVSLDSATPASSPDGTFDTLLRVTERELADGEHIRMATRRAMIIGFGGPHFVLGVHRLDIARDTPALEPVGPTRDLGLPASVQPTRLLSLLADGSESAPDAATVSAPAPSPPVELRVRRRSRAAR